MELTVNLADASININFLEDAKAAIPLCRQYFKGFIHPEQKSDHQIQVSVLKKTNDLFENGTRIQESVVEMLLSSANVAGWLRGIPGYRGEFPIDEKTICSFSMDGLLLFNPISSRGHIYLLQKGSGCFRPLHRLFWIYFAQVLGEKKSCFIHAAAMSRGKDGYIFLGDSGAGKSTLARASTKCAVLSDDSPVFCKRNGRYNVFSSPYHQMDQLKSNIQNPEMHAEVKGLYFLIKGDDFFLDKISKKNAVAMILSRYILFFHYVSKNAKRFLFDLFFEACHNLPTYYLHYLQGRDVWSIIGNE